MVLSWVWAGLGLVLSWRVLGWASGGLDMGLL